MVNDEERPDRWVYAGGTFDLFHRGHVQFLKSVREAVPGARLIVAVNGDEFAGRYKRKPILTQDERMDAVAGCRHVDMVCPNIGHEDSWKTISWLRQKGYDIRWIAHGNDWTGNDLLKQMGLTQGCIHALDVKMVYVPYTEGISSTDIIERIKEREHVPAYLTTPLVCCGDPGDCSC